MINQYSISVAGEGGRVDIINALHNLANVMYERMTEENDEFNFEDETLLAEIYQIDDDEEID